MNYEREISDIQDRFEGLKNDLATKQGALKHAVETLKIEHGIENARDAKSTIDKMEEDVLKWRTERDKLLAGLRETLNEIEGVDEDDDFED